MTLVRWRPFRELDTIQDEMNRLFENFFVNGRNGTRVAPFEWRPVSNFNEDEKKLYS